MAFEDLLRLQDQLAALLGAPAPAQSWWSSPGVYPPINVFRTSEGMVIKAELPGIRPEDVEITAEGRQLKISGERRGAEDERKGCHRRERAQGRFSRSVWLPDDVDLEHVDAQYRNGVLTLKIAVAAAAKPRQIAVKTA
jgi:HSP20 family protein